MPQTYTSPTLAVSNGEITSHDTADVASDINILSAECRWQGITTQTTNTYYEYDSNSTSKTFSGSQTTETETNSTGYVLDELNANDVIPSVPDGYSFDHHEIQYGVSNSSGSEQTVDVKYTLPDGTFKTTTITVANADVNYFYDKNNISTNYTSNPIYVELLTNQGDDGVKANIIAKTIGSRTVNEPVTKSISIPDPPSGYTFHKTDWYISAQNTSPFDVSVYIEYSGPNVSNSIDTTLSANSIIYPVDTTEYQNYTGGTIEATVSHPSVNVTLEATTEGEDTYTVTDTFETTDPFVTRDVDGSYSGTLSDGTWSSWVPLDGLATGVNEFYHNISGSGEAKFEFRYDWEYKFPEPVGGLLSVGARDGSQLHRVALADPTSSRLAYNHVRALVGGIVYAVDVVDPSDPDAIDWLRIGTQHGIVCPRAYSTESV